VDRRKVFKTLSWFTNHLTKVDVFQSSFGSVDLCRVQRSLWEHRCVEPDLNFAIRIDTVDVRHWSIHVVAQRIGVESVFDNFLLLTDVIYPQLKARSDTVLVSKLNYDGVISFFCWMT